MLQLRCSNPWYSHNQDEGKTICKLYTSEARGLNMPVPTQNQRKKEKNISDPTSMFRLSKVCREVCCKKAASRMQPEAYCSKKRFPDLNSTPQTSKSREQAYLMIVVKNPRCWRRLQDGVKHQQAKARNEDAYARVCIYIYTYITCAYAWHTCVHVYTRDCLYTILSAYGCACV